MLTDILIPLGKGSRHNNLELMYCLRSVEKHLKGVGNIWIVGERPDWVKGIVHIPYRDNHNNWMRANNIYSKIVAGIKESQDIVNMDSGAFVQDEINLSDNFLYVHDDHFLLQDYGADKFPYYHRGVIDIEKFKNNPPQYRQYENTISLLDSYRIYDYDIHCPMLINRSRFLADLLEDGWPQYGYCIKSTYAARNLDLIWPDAVEIDDLKFREPAMKETIYKVLEGRPWFSIGDRCLKSGGMQKVLAELYPNKSKWEK